MSLKLLRIISFSLQEKQPFVSHARELDNKHQEALKQDAIGIIKVISQCKSWSCVLVYVVTEK